jgi:hypothetical protein
MNTFASVAIAAAVVLVASSSDCRRLDWWNDGSSDSKSDSSTPSGPDSADAQSYNLRQSQSATDDGKSSDGPDATPTSQPTKTRNWPALSSNETTKPRQPPASISGPKPTSQPVRRREIIPFINGIPTTPESSGSRLRDPVNLTPRISVQLATDIKAFEKMWVHVYEAEDGLPLFATGISLDEPAKNQPPKILTPSNEFSLVNPSALVRVISHGDQPDMSEYILQPDQDYWLELVVYCATGRLSEVVLFRTRSEDGG